MVFADRRGDAFMSFLKSLSEGRCDRDNWSEFVVAHYGDERLEEARREIVRASISVEDFSWDEPLPDIVKNTATELLSKLAAKG